MRGISLKSFFPYSGYALVVTVLLVGNGILAGILIWQEGNRQDKDEQSYSHDIEDVKNAVPTFQGLAEHFIELSKKKGAPYAFEVLKRAALPPNTDLHLLAHMVGDELYKQEGISGMRFCTNDFRNACSHSVVVGALLEHGEAILPQVRGACEKAPGGKGAYTMCFHGLGHGVLAYTGYAVPEAVALCKKTATQSHKEREFAECVGGIVMEMASGVHDRSAWERQKTVYLKTDDPLFLCKGFMPEQAKEICYTYITPLLFEAAGADIQAPQPDTFARAFAFCDMLKGRDASGRAACFGGFGKEFVVLAQDRDIRRIEDTTTEQMGEVYSWCTLAGNREGMKSCLSSALNSLYWGGENTFTVAVRFCGVIDDTQFRDTCFSELIGNVSFYNEDTEYRIGFCNALPAEYGGNCRKALL